MKEPGSISTIAEAKAGSVNQEFTVQGIVTFADGTNVYVQDTTGGICAFSKKGFTGVTVSDLKRGDEVTIKGTYAVFNSLPELQNATIAKTDKYIEPTPSTKTIADISNADLCTLITVTDAIVSEISNKNVTIQQGDSTIQIYSAPALPEGLAVGDTVTVTAAVGTYNKLQLRTMFAEDIQITKKGSEEPVTPPAEEDPYLPKNGDKVVIFNPRSGKVLTGTANGSKLNGSDATVSGDKLQTDGSHLVLNVTIEGTGADAVYTFADDKYNLLTSGATGNSLTLEPKSEDKAQEWTITKSDDGSGYVIVSTTAEYTKGGVTSKQALEYYSGFTTYSVNTNDSKFIMLFYPENKVEKQAVEPEGPGYLPQSGDMIAVYNEANGMVLTGTSTGDTLAGATATVSGDKLTVAGTPLLLSVTVDGTGTDAVYTFADNEGNLLTSGATGNSLTLEPISEGKPQKWTITKTSDGSGYVIVSTTAAYNGKQQAIEVYSGAFTTYSVNTSDGKYIMRFYKAENVEGKPIEPVESGHLPVNGENVIVYNPQNGLVLTDSLSGTRLVGATATISGGKLFADGYLLLRVEVTGEGEDAEYKFFSEDGKVLATTTDGGNLTLQPATTDQATSWKLAKVSGGYTITSTVAFSNSKKQAIEVFSGNFTTYGIANSTDPAFVMQFFPEAQIGKDLSTDSDIEDTIAQWGGGGPYTDEQATAVKGDLNKTGDMLDEKAVFTAMVNGSLAKPYTVGTGAGSTADNPNLSYYMGGTGIGAYDGDYMQFALSTKGYGDMALSFRIRVSNTGPKQFKLQYSIDGENFINFETGSYSYSYTAYSGETQTPVSDSGSITDGIATTWLICIEDTTLSHKFI